MDALVITIGFTKGHGYWISRRDPRPEHPQIIVPGCEPRLYLHADGLWRTACVTVDGRTGYFRNQDELWTALVPAGQELANQHPEATIMIKILEYAKV